MSTTERVIYLQASERVADRELLPCPFCGGKAFLINDHANKVMVSCGDCYCCVGEGWKQGGEPDYVFGLEKDAIAAWNTRHKAVSC